MATATKHPHVQDTSNNSVRVEIFDQGYNLRGTDPDYILKLAEYVDSKMRAVAEQTHECHQKYLVSDELPYDQPECIQKTHPAPPRGG